MTATDAAPTDTDDLGRRANEIEQAEMARLIAKTPGSKALYERAVEHLPFGVASSFQAGDPYPIYIARGEGSRVWDADGNEYVDFHGGFGCNLVGHANPHVVEAIEKAARTGTHFAATTPVTVECAEEIARRFRLDKVRFTNSGTESTMDAIRVARAKTGRDCIVKIEGSYHGHHDPVMFSVVPNSDMMGGRDQPATAPMSRGIPKDVSKRTFVVPFNDAPAFEALLEQKGDEIACIILEPVMMNIGIVEPAPGYLSALREICTRFGVALIFDEVKSGASVAPGGALDRYDVQPDLACFAKALFGGTPGGAFGGSEEWMEVIEHGCAQQGTFNGNPLVAAAGVATLTKVLTPDAYAYLAKLGTRLASGCQAAIDANGIPAHTVDLGAKGCVSFRRERLGNYRDFLETRPELFTAAFPWALNRDIFMTPGDEEQWTLSVQHTEEDIDGYVASFTGFCEALAGRA
jgi:glutamate-1-semialdehyde 2,1-aminomutase